MRLISSFLLPALCWRLASAVDSAGHIYIHNPDQSQEPRSSTTLSPIAARLVLAQRVGVEEYHSADLADKQVVEAINDYGIRTPIFSDQKEDERTRVLLYVEGDAMRQYIDAHFPTSFSISPSPSTSSALELFTDLGTQVETAPHPYSFITFFSSDGRDSEIAELEQHLQRWIDSKALITVISLPPTPRAYGAGAEWGTYSMPTSTDLLKKRAEEKPLEQGPDSFQPIQYTTSPPSPLTVQAQEPLKGVFPLCFPSQSSCDELTRNCTGHGSCSLKYKDSSTEPAKSCYSCECSPTVRKDEEGRVSTTHWGGPACQKQDVSVQFWLIVLFSAGMVGLVSFAVGSVWGMGSEELPSVIGAGVSGPSARR